MTNKKRTLEDYKFDINLVDFILQPHYGFSVAKRSTNRHPRLERKDEKGNVVELYVIQKNSKGHFTYWSPYDNSIKGKTVIDFVQDRHFTKKGEPFNLGMVRGVLDSYIAGDKYIAPMKSNYQVANVDREKDKFLLEIKACKKYTDRTYLHQRGISDKTIDHPMFSRVIKNKSYTDAENNKEYVNTAYFMINEDGIGAINIKNRVGGKSFSGCIGERGTALVCSMLPQGAKKIDQLIITESFDDALSHYQMNEDKFSNKVVRYASTSGSLSEGQVELLEKNIQKLSPEEFVIGSDNDLGGEFFRAKLMGNMQINQFLSEQKDFVADNPSFAFVHIDCKRENNIGTIEFVFSNKDYEKGIKNISELKDYSTLFNEKHKDKIIDGEPFSFKVDVLDNDKSSAKITFKNNKDNWFLAAEFIHDVKYDRCKFFKRELPILKDFNEDLQASLDKNSNKGFEINV